MCFDRVTGRLLWQHDVGQGIRKDNRSNYASASPVTDGKLAIFFYGNGDLVCFDADGTRRWARNIQKDYGPFAFLWTFSSSPLLYDGRLYLQVLQRDVAVDRNAPKDQHIDSYLLALDPPSGRTLWRVVRPSEAVAESREAFTTPVPLLGAPRAEILVVGGDVLTGHDPATGKELWRWGTWNPTRIPHWRLVPSPVAGDGVALVCAPKRDPIYAIKLGGTGTLDEHAVAWTSRETREVSSDVPTPVFYDGDFFVLSDVRKCLSRVEPRTGKVKWTVPTPGSAKYEASPLAADGKLYVINFDGQVTIFQASDGQLLRTIAMDEPAGGEVVRSSIVAAHGQLFIRTTRKLYCVGTAAAARPAGQPSSSATGGPATAPPNPLVGTWKLVKIEERNEKGELVTPLDYGPVPIGILMYDATGHMSVHAMRRDRPKLDTEDVLRAKPEQAKTAFAGYGAYFGTYEVRPQESLVIHHVEGSLLPNWEGSAQRRRFTLAGDTLTLEPPGLVADGQQRTRRLTWQRVGPQRQD